MNLDSSSIERPKANLLFGMFSGRMLADVIQGDSHPTPNDVRGDLAIAKSATLPVLARSGRPGNAPRMWAFEGIAVVTRSSLERQLLTLAV